MSSRPRGGFRSGSLALLLLLTVPTHYCDASNRSRHLFHTHRNKTMQMIDPTKSNNNNNNLIPLPNKSLSTKISHECEWNASTIRARSLSLTPRSVRDVLFFFRVDVSQQQQNTAWNRHGFRWWWWCCSTTMREFRQKCQWTAPRLGPASLVCYLINKLIVILETHKIQRQSFSLEEGSVRGRREGKWGGGNRAASQHARIFSAFWCEVRTQGRKFGDVCM